MQTAFDDIMVTREMHKRIKDLLKDNSESEVLTQKLLEKKPTLDNLEVFDGAFIKLNLQKYN